MFGYVWRQLFQRKVRTALSMLGVSVSVAGIVALISLTQGMRTSLDRYMTASGASLIVISRDAAGLEYSNIAEDESAAVASIDGVAACARSSFTLLMNPRVAETHKKVFMMMVFGRFANERYMDRYEDMLIQGRPPRTPDEILVGKSVARDVRMKLDDELPLFRREHLGIKKYKVVGIYESEIAWENGGIVVNGEVVMKETGKPASLLFLYTHPSDRDRVEEAVNARFEHLVALPPAEFTKRFAGQMQVIDDFVLLITIVAVVVGVLGVLNTMMMSVSERTREIGMLRALGWPRRLVMRAIVTEGVLLSAVGGVLGLFVGVLGTEALIRFVPGGWLAALYEPSTFAYAGSIALVVGVLAAIAPAIRAANLRPVEALRYE